MFTEYSDNSSSYDSDDGNQQGYQIFTSVKSWLRDKFGTNKNWNTRNQKKSSSSNCCSATSEECDLNSRSSWTSSGVTCAVDQQMMTKQSAVLEDNSENKMASCHKRVVQPRPDNLNQRKVWHENTKNWLVTTQSNWEHVALNGQSAKDFHDCSDEDDDDDSWSTVSTEGNEDEENAEEEKTSAEDQSKSSKSTGESSPAASSSNKQSSAACASSCAQSSQSGIDSAASGKSNQSDTNTLSSVSSTGTARDILKMKSVSDFPSEMTKSHMNMLLKDNAVRIAHIETKEKQRAREKVRPGHGLKIKHQIRNRANGKNCKWFRSWSALFALHSAASGQGNKIPSKRHNTKQRKPGLSRSRSTASMDNHELNSAVGAKLSFIPLSSPYSSLWLTQDLWNMEGLGEAEASSQMPTLAKKYRHKKPKTSRLNGKT